MCSNGSKCFITNGTVASTMVVFAMTDPKAGNHGISAFIVESSFPGFSTGKKEKKMGIRGSSTCDLIFEDCIVPKGEPAGQGRRGASRSPCRPWTAAVSASPRRPWAWARGAIDEAVKYTQERIQFKKRLSQFQNTQFQLADMHTRMKAAQFLVYSARLQEAEPRALLRGRRHGQAVRR